MHARFLRSLGLVTLLLFGTTVGCESNPEFLDREGQTDGSGGASMGGSGDGDLSLGGGDGDGDTGSGGTPVSPCGDIFCTQEARCEVMGDTAECVANTCEELDCSGSEECVENSLGAYCEDLSCDANVDCAADRYCDSADGICKDDLCVPGARSCSPDGTPGTEGNAIYICRSSGGGYRKEVDCGSVASFTSVCVEKDAKIAGCGCEDDWDCPGFQECEAGICQGSLNPPECRLEPADISDVLPSQELVWGTAPADNDEGRLQLVDGVAVPLLGTETGATGEPEPASLSAWSNSTQVTVPPIVANLDDDNGDGLIDERDVPEILFLTFTSTGVANSSGNANNDGVLRVIHGGGTDSTGVSKKGRDYLSVCGGNRWFGGSYWDSAEMELGSEPGCGNVADLDPAATLAVGDLNYDGVPEIVAFGEEDDNDDFNTRNGRFMVFDNTGRLLIRSPMYAFQGTNSSAENPGISLANLAPTEDPADDMVEVIIGRDVFTLAVDMSGDWSISGRYSGTSASGINAQGPISCVADLIPDRPGVELVAGTAVYGIPLSGSELDTGASNLVTLGSDNNAQGFCAIADVWGSDKGAPPGPANPLDQSPEIVLIRDGSLYVYALDFTPPPTPSDEWVVTLTEVSGTPELPGGSGGGAPNVDDFDGDGFPEIGTAGNEGYILFDLQADTGGSGACQPWNSFSDPSGGNARTPPGGNCEADADCNADPDPATWNFACNETANVGEGACVCLHNGWRRLTQDDSSEVTGSSVFDFNGDGAAEVIYNDECHFRMYSGIDGSEIFLEESESRTRIEYPVVADVDNDGNAEIVFATTTESGFCNDDTKATSCTMNEQCPSFDQPNGQSCIGGYCRVADEGVFNAGIEVWGDLSDRWVSARRVWNQYSYHVTNVNESGQIPRVEPNSWQPLGARLYNTYRSQPRSFGSAPDLVVEALQVIAPGSCGASTDLTIGVEVRNAGDLRVSNIPVRLVGTWDDAGVTEELTDDMGTPLEIIITQTLEPEGSSVFQVDYNKDDNPRGAFPDRVTVVIDPADTGDGVARECREDNNTATEDVDASPPLPDLRLVLDNPDLTCPPPVTGTVFNDSNVAAGDVVVRIYAGDPSTGAKAIGDIPIGSVMAGASVDFDSTDFGPNALEDAFDVAFPTQAPILLYGEVDPDDQTPECNEANNIYGPTTPTSCQQIR